MKPELKILVLIILAIAPIKYHKLVAQTPDCLYKNNISKLHNGLDSSFLVYLNTDTTLIHPKDIKNVSILIQYTDTLWKDSSLFVIGQINVNDKNRVENFIVNHPFYKKLLQEMKCKQFHIWIGGHGSPVVSINLAYNRK